MSRKQIFNEQGFLTTEGKAFVNERFTKEVSYIMSTADTNADRLIISSILKSIVAEGAIKSMPDSPKKTHLQLVKNPEITTN